MRFDVLTIFPDLISDYCGESLLGRAQKKRLLKIAALDIRKFSKARHAHVDDKPYGGGAGMVMQVEPIWRALKSLRVLGAGGRVKTSGTSGIRVILMSAKGKKFDDAQALRLAKYKRVILICGRYEGVDERVAKNLAHEEISVGPYVLQGGEIAALAVIEAASRYVKGVLGNAESVKEETRGSEKEYPQYTRPEKFNGWKVPQVLLSGDHKKIAAWRKKQQGV